MRIVPRNIIWVLRNGLLLLLLMSLFRIVFWLAFPNPAPQSALAAFVLGLRYDVRIVAIPILSVWLLSCIPLLNPFTNRRAIRIWNIFHLALLFIVLIFYAVDFAHFAYLHQRLNGSVIGYMQDTVISTKMIWQSYPVVTCIVIILLFLTAMYLLLRYNFKCTGRYEAVSCLRYGRISSATFGVLLLLCIYGRPGAHPLGWHDAFTVGNDYNANLSLNPFQSFGSTLVLRNPGYRLNEVQSSYPQMAAYLGVTHLNPQTLSLKRDVAPAPKRDSQTPPTNVVLVICESFSAYKSSMWGNPLNTTPFFNSLCGHGIFFDHCFAPSYNTARGVWATVTGVPDVSLISTNSRQPNMQSQHTIINDFKGYEKFYFVGGTADWANLRSLLQNNIDSLHLYEQNDYHVPKADVWGVSDKNVFLGANKVLAQQQKPFFAIIQTADNHRPYTIPPEDTQAFQQKKLPLKTLRQYGFESTEEYNAFRYTDFCFQQFMEAAQKETYFSNTLFVFVGDHGIRGNAGNMLPSIWTQQGLTSLHVPLLFYQPSYLSSRRISWPASQTDILPTIAGICGIGYTNTTLGMDLLDTVRNTAFATQKWVPIFDDLKQQAGVFQGNVFYEKPFSAESGNIYSAVDNEPPSNMPDSMMSSFRFFTDAWIEWSRYLGENNRKLKN